MIYINQQAPQGALIGAFKMAKTAVHLSKGALQYLTELYNKLAGMTQAQQFAALDAVRLFWASGYE